LTDEAAIPVMRSRFVPAGLHLLASAAVAAVGALLIFTVWYPVPFNLIAGGTSLFLLLVSVDVVLGPALTLVAASPGKSRREFRRDLAIIVAVQLAAFCYGLYTIALARPVFESFEVDRFRVVTAADIEANELEKAPPGMRTLPWLGPKLIAAVPPSDPQEYLKSIELGLAGMDLSMIPSNWRTYESYKEAAWRAAKPVSKLIAHYPSIAEDLAKAAAKQRKSSVELRYLPLVSRQASWVVLLASPDARPIAYLPVDGFI
jgi:hypothetical protein